MAKNNFVAGVTFNVTCVLGLTMMTYFISLVYYLKYTNILHFSLFRSYQTTDLNKKTIELDKKC